MPEPDPRIPLDVALARGRTDLLDRIDQPPLARIQHRAASRRRQRGRAAVAGALVAVVVAGAPLLRPETRAVNQAPPPLADATTAGPIYSDAGITINGLAGELTDVPGTITAIEFTDPDHGYLLAECVDTAPCPASVARTSDGGVNWQVTELPGATRDRTGLDLLAFPDGHLVVSGGGTYTSADEGRTWQVAPAGAQGSTPARPGDRLRRQPGPTGAGGCGGTVRVWRSGSGQPADVGALDPGAVDVCWVAPDAASDGAWWIGGTSGGQPVAAVTRDGGVTWTLAPLDVPAGPVGTVRVAVLGSRAYAAVLGPDGSIRGLFHSADQGRTFSRTSAGPPAGGPGGLAGALVPLLDGRLLATGTDHRWYVSTDDGRSFTLAAGNLPPVGALARTDAGYVAYQLFSNGWAAYSADGSTWRKLQIR